MDFVYDAPYCEQRDCLTDLEKSEVHIYSKCMSAPEWCFKAAQLGEGDCDDEIRINLKLARRWQHYVYRIVVIMGVVSLAACFGIFIPSASIDGQLGYLSGMLLASVAYLYVVGDSLPKLPFLTILDEYTMMSITFVSFLIIEKSLISFLHAYDETPKERSSTSQPVTATTIPPSTAELSFKETFSFKVTLTVFFINFFLWAASHLFFLVRSVRARKMANKTLTDFPQSPQYNKYEHDGCVACLMKEKNKIKRTAPDDNIDSKAGQNENVGTTIKDVEMGTPKVSKKSFQQEKKFNRHTNIPKDFQDIIFKTVSHTQHTK